MVISVVYINNILYIGSMKKKQLEIWQAMLNRSYEGFQEAAIKMNKFGDALKPFLNENGILK